MTRAAAAAMAVALMCGMPGAGHRAIAQAAYPEPPKSMTAEEVRTRRAQHTRLLAALDAEARRLAGNDRARYVELLRKGRAAAAQEVQRVIDWDRGNTRSGGAPTEPTLRLEELRAAARRLPAERSEQPGGSSPTRPDDVPPRPMIDVPNEVRVQGGEPVAGADLPEVVALRGLANGNCTGVRIAPGVALTAAHCFCKNGAPTSQTGTVVVGQVATAAGVVQHPISRVEYYHPQSCKLLDRGRDLAIVRFGGDNPSARSATIMEPIVDYLVARPSRLVVVGFGRTGVDNKPSGVKRMASVAMNSRLCHGGQACEPGRELVLADPHGYIDTCPGDSGGPAFHVDTGKSRDWYLSAITSRGTGSAQDCGSGGVYTIVTAQAVRWLCGLNIVPSVAGTPSPCGGASAQAAPSAVAGVQPAPSQPPPSQPTQSQSPVPVAATVLRQCLATSCGDLGEYQCAQQCLCRQRCETQYDAATCGAFCAQSKQP